MPPLTEGRVPVMDGGGDKPIKYFDFKEYQTLITSYICLLLVEGELIGDTNEWEKCNPDCISILKGLVDIETSMTFYWIKYLNACLIKSSDSSKIEITCDDSMLTGLWDEDKNKLKIVVKSDEGVNNINGVIPVIGPSASGKTVWVVNLVKSLGEGGQELIKHIYGERVSEPYLAGVINIDGGIMREMTDVGRAIVDCLRSQERLNIGISNYHGNIFNTDDIKVKLIDFLSNVHRVHRSEFMVALPDTATSISILGKVGPNFISYMLNTLGISGFTTFIPICFNVYQHITGRDCKFKDLTFIEGGIREGGFRCVGCTESGESREKEEGKKNDSGVVGYKYHSAHSFAQDIIKYLEENNTICLKIHNSGRRVERLEDGTTSGYSIITIRSPEDKIGLVNNFLNILGGYMDFFIRSMDGSITPPS